MSRFSERAKAHVAGSPVLENREKMSTDEIIARYPQGVTIIDFDFLNGKQGRYVVCAFKESPQNYFNGGKILTDIFEEFLTEYSEMVNPLEACRKDFSDEGGLKVKLSHGRTKDGNNVTLVDIID